MCSKCLDCALRQEFGDLDGYYGYYDILKFELMQINEDFLNYYIFKTESKIRTFPSVAKILECLFNPLCRWRKSF